ncbi:hypothetical protein D3C73_1242690 [compost metagenome]
MKVCFRPRLRKNVHWDRLDQKSTSCNRVYATIAYWVGGQAPPKTSRIYVFTQPRPGADGLSYKQGRPASYLCLNARCLRFAAPVTRSPCKTRFRSVANLYRAGFIPPGFLTPFHDGLRRRSQSDQASPGAHKPILYSPSRFRRISTGPLHPEGHEPCAELPHLIDR